MSCTCFCTYRASRSFVGVLRHRPQLFVSGKAQHRTQLAPFSPSHARYHSDGNEQFSQSSNAINSPSTSTKQIANDEAPSEVFQSLLKELAANVHTKEAPQNVPSSSVSTGERRTLPSDRTRAVRSYQEGAEPGKLTPRQLDELFSLRASDSGTWTSEKLAVFFEQGDFRSHFSAY